MNEILPQFETPAVPGLSAPQAPTGDALQQDTFLRLLTEQLQHQDPLDPMKNEEFVAQLAQFSSLEQLFGLQATMEAVYLGIASMNNASMATLLGTEVVAETDTFHYGGEGSVPLHFDAERGLSSATITITDESGRVVDTIEISGRSEGEFVVEWDGTGIDGQRQPEGDYTFTIAATDVEGEPVEVATLVVGVVDEMDYSEGSPRPSIGGVAVPLESIRRLTSPESPAGQ